MCDLTPLSLHPLHAGDGVSTYLGNEGGCALCRGKRGRSLSLKLTGIRKEVEAMSFEVSLTLGDIRGFGFLDEEQIFLFLARSSSWSLRSWLSYAWLGCN